MASKLSASKEKARRATESNLNKKNSFGLKAAAAKRSETNAFRGLAYATGTFNNSLFVY